MAGSLSVFFRERVSFLGVKRSKRMVGQPLEGDSTQRFFSVCYSTRSTEYKALSPVADMVKVLGSSVGGSLREGVMQLSDEVRTNSGLFGHVADRKGARRLRELHAC
jgi:translation initiation factor 2 gamma subunit (eIF-2gamma)